jgi:protein-S-isoprenylcysteine O-methyltransferase Ste14
MSKKAVVRTDSRVNAKSDTGEPKSPELFAWLASVVTLSLIVITQFLPRGSSPVLRAIGVPVLLLASVFIFWPFYLLAKHGGRDSQRYMQTALVVDRGLYAITRHPQYLGYTVLSWGFALLSQHWVTWLLAGVGTTCFYLQAAGEETYCVSLFGEPYVHYRRRVPRFNILLGLVRLLWGGEK